MSNAKDQPKKEVAQASVAKEQKKAYFKSTSASGLTILKKDSTTVVFDSFWDTFKGDPIRVGYLATDDEEVIDRCRTLNIVVELTVDEYKKEISGLTRTPISSM